MPVKPPIDTEDSLIRRRPKRTKSPSHTTYFIMDSDDSGSAVSIDTRTTRPPDKKKKPMKVRHNWQEIKKNTKKLKKVNSALDEIQIFLFFSHENKERMKIIFAYLEDSFFLTNGKHHSLLDEMEDIKEMFDEDETYTDVGTGKEYCDLNTD